MTLTTACVSKEDTFIEAKVYDPLAKKTEPVQNIPQNVPIAQPVVKAQTPVIQNTNALLSIDLNDANYSKLKENGGYVIVNDIVIAKNATGAYIACTLYCSHDNLKRMVFRNEEWFCTAHDARFTQSGSGLNKVANRGLQVYKTSLKDSILSIN
jgi:nitrite reductase/ring-hydroxylating ferredoxin subunit